MSGGSVSDFSHEVRENGNLFALTRHTIDNRQIIDLLLRGDAGAVITFEGMVRNNTKGRRTRCLDYECYEPMAIKMMAEIGREIACRSPIERIAMVHRLGRLLIGETSVSIIVSAPHRELHSMPRWRASIVSRSLFLSGRRNISWTAKSGWKESGTNMRPLAEHR